MRRPKGRLIFCFSIGEVIADQKGVGDRFVPPAGTPGPADAGQLGRTAPQFLPAGGGTVFERILAQTCFF